jgi:hypothetical protein
VSISEREVAIREREGTIRGEWWLKEKREVAIREGVVAKREWER